MFEIAEGTAVQLSDMRLSGGRVSTDAGGTGSGGAIVNSGVLAAEDMDLFGNSAAHGGGIANTGGTVQPLYTITRWTVSSNSRFYDHRQF